MEEKRKGKLKEGRANNTALSWNPLGGNAQRIFKNEKV